MRFRITYSQSDMDTQNDGLQNVDSFRLWPFLVSMLDFWGVRVLEFSPFEQQHKVFFHSHSP